MNLRRNVVSIVDALVTDLRTRILDGELVPGTALREVEVAQRYEVSRPTARSALDALVGVRLLTRSAHKTARVVKLTPDDVSDIYRTRALIESQVVRELALDAKVPDGAVRANREIRDLRGSAAVEVIGPDLTFHRSLVNARGSERTRLAYDVLIDEVGMCMSQVQGAGLLDATRISAEHAAILDAIGGRDGEQASRLLVEHLENARTRLIDHMAAAPGPSAQ
ncbi:GntR family transcriptional regulator [Leucobacter sp. wl10]|uniref:GntR family transcriptional regulator n=1 Tax=Leucobacter sp. wl10 TaxID=2304677 RepID=UPI000E5B615D|nr:GntR family transcriptional regulator [Leucobacter sp. wl10]RGE18560.1 GntR family transcriptional regulator [Leucobacter sp. wl10]